MTTNWHDDEPDEASFEAAALAVGNEIRIRILTALAGSDTPVPFSTLQEQLGIDHGGRFDYHLDKLRGHFVRKTEHGYTLRQPGRRVVEAIRAGTLTDQSEVAPVELQTACSICGTRLQLSYGQERVELYCPGCPGNYGPRAKDRESIVASESGFIGGFRFPPTGVVRRDPDQVLRAGSLWANVEMICVAKDVCPRCAATVDHAVRVCEGHDTTDGLCDRCDRRHQVQIRSECTNCLYAIDSFFLNHLLANDALRCFVAEHGIDPLGTALRWGWEYDETVHSIEPFAAAFTFRLDDDEITLTVDETLTVVEVTRHGRA